MLGRGINIWSDLRGFGDGYRVRTERRTVAALTCYDHKMNPIALRYKDVARSSGWMVNDAVVHGG